MAFEDECNEDQLLRGAAHQQSIYKQPGDAGCGQAARGEPSVGKYATKGSAPSLS
jgi:hypothetical protein